jgi:CDP-glycerol glycerophosphotransferase (TagB/SpsB family)/glycosyltransferase involved in cell wall biosynthesis
MNERVSPFFSVIVPAYGVQGFLRACLDSIVTQSFRDFEVIAVDDASPDNSGAILDVYADADHRVRVVHLERNVGLGLARQEAMGHARGRYLLFVDSDDVVAPGSFAAIADRITATGEPDVVIFDYERTYTTGRRLRNVLHEYFARPGPDVFTIAERPEFLTLLMVVWNKAYKREFVEHYGFAFGPGYYEDTPWTYPTLLEARSIAVLDRVCIHYRQRRTGNILRDKGRKQFDVFDQYERLFAFLDAHPELDQWRSFLFGRMMRHYLTILTRRQRIDRSMRRDFFARMAEHYRRFRPAGTPTPGGVDGVKWRLVAMRLFRLFLFLSFTSRVLGATRTKLGTMRRRVRRTARGPVRRLRRAYYRLQLRLPMDERLAVFAAYWYRSYSCNPKAIDDTLRVLAPQIRSVWVLRPDAKVPAPPNVSVVRPGTLAYYRAIGRAKFLVNNVNFPNELVKRDGSVHVQTHHGTPLKTMGVDLQAFPVGAEGMDFEALLLRCDKWDVSLSSNAFTSEVWEHAYPAAYRTFESGYPRNDRLFDVDPAEVRRIREALGIQPGATAVLYLPTHREHQAGYVPTLDVEAVAEALGPDYALLLRTHYYYRDGSRPGSHDARGSDAHVIDVSDHAVVEDLYLAADVLVTDYSSAMFDFANLDRPIVIHAPDWETYQVTRGVYFDLFETPPGPVARDDAGLINTLRTRSYASAESTARRARFRHLFCQFDDGRAAERVVRHVFLGEPVDTRHPVAVLPAGLMARERPVPSPAGEPA